MVIWCVWFWWCFRSWGPTGNIEYRTSDCNDLGLVALGQGLRDDEGDRGGAWRGRNHCCSLRQIVRRCHSLVETDKSVKSD